MPNGDDDTSDDDDGEATTTDDDPTDTSSTTDPDSSTGNVGEFAAYRFDSITIHDPHFFAVIGDVTADVNARLDDALDDDSSDGDPPQDGFLDFGLVLMFRPFEPTDGFSAQFQFANARCTAPAATTSCVRSPGTQLFDSTYVYDAAGPCLAADEAELTDYPDAPGWPTPTTGPCFVAEPTDVLLQTTTFSLPLSDATVAAKHVGDPAGLVEGNLQGFLSTADSEVALVENPVLGLLPMSDLLREEDKDGDGWRVFVSFTAVPVPWTD